MHLLTNVQRCEVEHIAGGVARYVGDAHEDIVIGPQLVLAVLQSAPAAGGPRGVRAGRTEQLRRPEGQEGNTLVSQKKKARRGHEGG